jgi:heme/copper-type cytochrome/quinol oxidase subunit 3
MMNQTSDLVDANPGPSAIPLSDITHIHTNATLSSNDVVVQEVPHQAPAEPAPEYEEPAPLKSNLHQFKFTWGLTLITAIFIAVTSFYAYNATLKTPRWRAILPNNPSRTILIINILSHVTVILLKVSTTAQFEAIRWVFGMRTGVPALTLVTLSPGTGALGVLYLIRHGARNGISWLSDHRLWGFQRYYLV